MQRKSYPHTLLMIRIVIVDDQKLIRQGLKALLELDSDLQVVGSANDGQSAIEQVEALKPDIVLIDIRMPGMDGVTATRIISDRFPDTKAIVLSGYDDEEYLADALRAGAKGYLLKDTPAEDLVNVIRSVYIGYSQIGPGLLEKITGRITTPDSVTSKPADLKMTVQRALQLQVESQLDKFEPTALQQVVRLAREQRAIAQLLAYMNNLLPDYLNNPAALYLTGVLLAQNGEEDRPALHYLKLGFQSGLQRELPREDLLWFYRAGLPLQATEAFSWLTQVNAPWNNEEGLSFLLLEAERLFGKAATQYRTLLVLWQIRAMLSLSDSCAVLGGIVGQIH